MRHLWTVAAVAMVLAGCDQKTSAPAQMVTPGPASIAPVAPPPAAPSAPLTGFTHVKGEDLFGYYIPNTEVKIGDLKLDHVHIGSEAEFAQWEGGDRTTTYAPIMLEFSDLASAKSENELGQTVYAHTIRVLPTAYKLGAGDLRFTGTDPTLGAVQLDGMIDMAALARARAAGPGAQETILRTALLIGATPFKTLSFNWFGGD
ncbi:hypothetical protein [Phenylobacterium aquaticum]|uniref:hypothetical protein n=1 Tax=Phenylobacterium aquaticum TaxID=1763816 RepID=UPI0026F03F25|nr:hypothetical protein [Phenylobacterium aquaticum]